MLVEIHLLRSPRRGAQAAGRSQEAWAWLLATLGTLKSVSCLRVKWAMNPTLSLTVSLHPNLWSWVAALRVGSQPDLCRYLVPSLRVMCATSGQVT